MPAFYLGCSFAWVLRQRSLLNACRTFPCAASLDIQTSCILPRFHLHRLFVTPMHVAIRSTRTLTICRSNGESGLGSQGSWVGACGFPKDVRFNIPLSWNDSRKANVLHAIAAVLVLQAWWPGRCLQNVRSWSMCIESVDQEWDFKHSNSYHLPRGLLVGCYSVCTFTAAEPNLNLSDSNMECQSSIPIRFRFQDIDCDSFQFDSHLRIPFEFWPEI